MIKFRPLPDGLKSSNLNYLIATWGQSGRIRPMSGTWGSLAAIPFCLLVNAVFGKAGLIIIGAMLFYLALKAIPFYVTHVDNPDPSEIVIDEVIGMMIMWLFIPQVSFMLVLVGFILFRVFDSIKIGPVGWCDKNVKGAIGVIADDIVAGLMAGIVTYVFYRLFLAV